MNSYFRHILSRGGADIENEPVKKMQGPPRKSNADWNRITDPTSLNHHSSPFPTDDPQVSKMHQKISLRKKALALKRKQQKLESSLIDPSPQKSADMEEVYLKQML